MIQFFIMQLWFVIKQVKALMGLGVLLVDEVSMIDMAAWETMARLLSTTEYSRRPNESVSIAFGNNHMVLSGDFKQLPPTTSKAEFVTLPERIHSCRSLTAVFRV